MSASSTAKRPAELLATLGAQKLANIIVSMVAPAGAIGDRWDSGTIETVLQPLERPFKDLGIEWIGNTGYDETALRYWLIEERKLNDPSWELIDESFSLESLDDLTRDQKAVELIFRAIANNTEAMRSYFRLYGSLAELHERFKNRDVSTPDDADTARDEWEMIADELGLYASVDEEAGVYRVTNLTLED